MRLRNVSHAKELINDNPHIVVNNPNEIKGNWSREFNNPNPIHIEIGCGKGKFITELAKNNPNINYIGIEKFDSVIVRAIEKLIEEPLNNVKLIRIDAENLNEIFDKGEVRKIYLNFSDPWPKNAHAKRRLTSDRFLVRYQNILINDSYIQIKTDNYGLFEYSLMSINSFLGFTFTKILLDLYQNLPTDNIQTEFEKKFVEKGNRIYFLEIKYIGD
jgi:tRNA (guanine-N7-)-methyltransferase